jgi:integrase
VSQGGTKTFLLKHQNSFITLGRFGVLTLSEARTEAKRLLAEFTLGKVRPQSITYQNAIELFLEEKTKARRARTVADYKRLLNRFNFKGQLSELTHQELQRRIKRFTAEGEYNHLLVTLKVFCNWAIKRRYIEHNPTMGLSGHHRPTRSRVLTDAELKAVWNAAGQIQGHAGTITKLLMLTGQRRGEMSALRADYVCDNLCTIPKELAKNGREHTFPLGTLAPRLLEEVTPDPCGLLFPARGCTTPFNGWGKSKAQLDKLANIAPWTLHDLRRTFATNLAQLGVAPHIIERLLNHISGQISGVSAIYNRATYLDEMTAAIQQWEAKLASLLSKD